MPVQLLKIPVTLPQGKKVLTLNKQSISRKRTIFRSGSSDADNMLARRQNYSTEDLVEEPPKLSIAPHSPVSPIGGLNQSPVSLFVPSLRCLPEKSENSCPDSNLPAEEAVRAEFREQINKF